ncbi:MAG: hypothetical protein JNM84_02580 [Planctomycetes bacterium]|nr:hypothetical protein [Planctomycetota bacterium]
MQRVRKIGTAALVAASALGWVSMIGALRALPRERAAQRAELAQSASASAARATTSATVAPVAHVHSAQCGHGDGLQWTRAAASIENPQELRPFAPGERPGTKLVGDIMTLDPECPKAQEYARQNGISLSSAFVGSTWPGGMVPYVYDANVTQSNRNAMRLAMDEWEEVADVTFVERTNETYYLRIFDGSGNWSYVGRLPSQWQPQDVSIYNWGWRFIMAHELAHALGFLHEQSRPDRDSYVQILTQNINSQYISNFNIDPNAQTFGMPYNYESIMHYGRTAFSTNGQDTIRTIDTSKQNLIGNRSYLSSGDASMMAEVYGTPAGAPLLTVTAPNGGELWALGGTYSITWSSVGNVGAAVDIELSRDGGNSWELLFDDSANDGLEVWMPTGAVTSQAVIRVSDSAAPAVKDTSDASFTLRPGVLRILGPNGGEILDIGGETTITWSTMGSISGSVDLLLSRDGGSNWTPLFLATPNDGSEVWSSIAGPATTNARLRVRDAAAPENGDESDANFRLRVPPLVLSSRLLVQQMKITRRGDGQDAIALSGLYSEPAGGLELRSAPTTIRVRSASEGGSGWTAAIPGSGFLRKGTRWSYAHSSGNLRVDVDTARRSFRVRAKALSLDLPTRGTLLVEVEFPTLAGAQAVTAGEDFRLGRSELRDVFFVDAAEIVRTGAMQGDSMRVSGWFRPAIGHDAPVELALAVDCGGSFSEELVAGSLQPSSGSVYSFRRRLREGLSTFTLDRESGRFTLAIDAVDLGSLTNQVPVEIRLGDELIGNQILELIGDPASRLSLR